MTTSFEYHQHLKAIAEEDARITAVTDREYASSWKKRGGVGAYFTLARKWDRIDPAVAAKGWNIFEAIAQDTRAEGLIDDIRDLRRYLLLVEAEMRQTTPAAALLTKRDTDALQASYANLKNFVIDGFTVTTSSETVERRKEPRRITGNRRRSYNGDPVASERRVNPIGRRRSPNRRKPD